MSNLLREIQFSGLRSEIKDSKLVSDIDSKLNRVISLVETGQSENGLKIVQFIRKVCWEQLNIGEYSKIDPIWRMAYYDCSILECCCLIDLSYPNERIYKIIDQGLLMGIKDSSNTLQYLISLLDQGQMRSNPPTYSNVIFKAGQATLKLPHSTVRTMNPPSLSDWLKIRNEMKPVVIKNLISDWPALQKWDLNYFWTVMAQRTVPIEIGKRYTDADWGQKLLRFEDFLSKLYKGDETKEKVYLAQHPLLEQIPQLENDIIVPDYCYIGNNGDDAELNAWIGPEGTISSLHTDNKYNLFAQIKGRKLFKLIDPEYSSKFEVIDEVMFNSSRLDIENNDVIASLNSDDVIIENVILEEGDVLFIPKLYWHYVRSLTASISLSMWFE